MRLHDAYARHTPVELAFPDPAEAGELFERIGAEARADGVDPTDLQGFMTLAAVAGALRELRAPEVGGEAVHRYAVLLQHVWLFHRAGGRVHLLTTPAARYLVGGAPAAEPVLPAEAGYLQLPLHLFWVAAGAETPESVDGLFWSMGSDGMLRLLMATGIHPGRPGLSVVPVAEAPWSDAPSWLEASIRSGGDDFACTLPGAEWDGLHSLESAGEALKLVARVFAHLASGRAPADDEAPRVLLGAGTPLPSRLPFSRILLDADA